MAAQKGYKRAMTITWNYAAGNETVKGFTEAFEKGGGKVIKAEVPLSEMFGYSTTLRSMSQGRATYTMEFKHYAEAPKNVAESIIAARAK